MARLIWISALKSDRSSSSVARQVILHREERCATSSCTSGTISRCTRITLYTVNLEPGSFHIRELQNGKRPEDQIARASLPVRNPPPPPELTDTSGVRHPRKNLNLEVSKYFSTNAAGSPHDCISPPLRSNRSFGGTSSSPNILHSRRLSRVLDKFSISLVLRGP